MKHLWRNMQAKEIKKYRKKHRLFVLEGQNMERFKNHGSKKKKSVTVTGFGGVDLTNSAGEISIKRSVCGTNMIRDSVGKVKKRFGYKILNDFSECIYGIYYFVEGNEKKMLVHSGNKLYEEKENSFSLIFSDMAKARSSGVCFGGRIVICDGEKLRYYDGEKVGNIEDVAYTPTVVVGRSPSGGGTFYEEVNMLTSLRKESFISDDKSNEYYLTSENIDEIVSVKVRNGDTWNELRGYVDYFYNLAEGYVRLVDIPYFKDGEDNVEILYKKKNEEYLKIINTSTIMTLYGLNGSMDRLFLAGNSVYPNRDYYSSMNTPAYFPDINYNVFGRDDSPIMGYSMISGKIAVHKYNEENNANIILREGAVNGEQVYFKMTGSYVCDGAVSKYAFGVIDNEPAYLSKMGICAITPNDVLGERYSQVRSYYLNGQLLKEKDLSSAQAVSYDGFYMLSINQKVYILDSLKYTSEGNNAFSHRQYEAYLWDNIPINIMFSGEDGLFFGTKDGALCVFCKSGEENCYLDGGKPFQACWELPCFLGDDFSEKKTIVGFSLMTDSPSEDTVIEYYDKGWQELLKVEADETVLSKRIHLKNTTNPRFRIRNASKTPLQINAIKITYIDSKEK